MSRNHFISTIFFFSQNYYKTVLNRNEPLTIGIKPAVELSFLSTTNQQLVADAIDYNQATPSHAQSIEIRKLEEQNKLNEEVLDEIVKNITKVKNSFFILFTS